MAANRAQNPVSEYLLKIQLIINNTEFKNKEEADLYETYETKMAGDEYVRAMNKTDIFESYTYNPKTVYSVLEAHGGYTEDVIFYFINNPQMMPQLIKNKLTEMAREQLISKYVESNRYYVRLTGRPFPGNATSLPETILTIPDEFYRIYQDDNAIERNQAIHELPVKYQELFMNSPYYQQMVNDNPDAKYLLYIGSNSIPIHISRAAEDGAILRINTNKLFTYNEIFGNITVSPDIIHQYTNAYEETRNYIYNTLRGDFSSIYPNYNNLIRFLTIYMSIGNTLNELMKKSTSMIYMNNVTCNNFFMLYGLPSVIMEGPSMVDFLKKFRLLLMDKATNTVYRVKDLIGYEYTDIYTLVMVKQQVFEKGVPIYHYDSEGNKIPKQEIVFRRLGTTDDNTSYFKFRENEVSYTVDEITSGDPRWWNTPEVEQMLQDMNYTLSNSKYIQLSTHLSMTDIWWQCVILLRGLLDRKQETQFTKLNINLTVDGSSDLTVFDAVLVLVILMHWHLTDHKGNTMSGNMYLPNGTYNGKEVCLDLLFNGLNDDGSPKDLILGSPYKISSFNFQIRENSPSFYNSISSMDYIDPDVFLPMLNKILDRTDINVGEVLMTDVRLLYKYLEEKLRSSYTISQFRQVTDVFNNLFLVDPVRTDWYDDTTFDVEATLMEMYNITANELASLKSFFFNNVTDLTITYNDESYPIELYDVLNEDVLTLEINEVYPFRDDGFVSAFLQAMKTYNSSAMMLTSISANIKNNYQSIISDKVILDVSNTSDGPKTFESLLFRNNPTLYRYLVSIKDNGNTLVLLMRSIIKALETTTNSKLNALEFQAIGVEEHFHIIKEVIGYFKSYMVEFTKDEFVYLFDGLFDNGGNSNMLRLYDDITSAEIHILPTDSLTLYDVSHADVNVKMPDNNIGMLHDEAIFRVGTTYQNILDSSYEIWYDDGKSITRTPFDIDPDTEIIANVILSEDGEAPHRLIININNLDVIPPNYYGNAR